MLLNATKREILGRKVKTLRANKQVPATIYGASRNPSSTVTLSMDEVKAAYKEFGYSKIFDIQLEGEKTPSKVVFKEIQKDTLTNTILHVSLHQIEMNKKITAEVPVNFVGLSMAVKNNLGLLITPLSKINVHCLPTDLPGVIEIDISVLDNVGDTILLDKIKLPEGVEVGHGTPKDAVLAYISAPQKIEEEAPKAVESDAAAAIPVEGAEGAEKAEPEKEKKKK